MARRGAVRPAPPPPHLGSAPDRACPNSHSGDRPVSLAGLCRHLFRMSDGALVESPALSMQRRREAASLPGSTTMGSTPPAPERGQPDPGGKDGESDCCGPAVVVAGRWQPGHRVELTLLLFA